MQNLEQTAQEEELEVPALAPTGVGFWERITPKFIREAREVRKQSGFKGLIRRYGWKLFAVFFCYYLIRDSILYILLPYLIARGLWN